MCTSHTSHVTGLQQALTVATALSSWATNNIAKGWKKKSQTGQNNKYWCLHYILKTRKQQQAVSANSKQRGSNTHAIQNEPDSLGNYINTTIYFRWHSRGRNRMLKYRSLEGAGLCLDNGNHPVVEQCPFKKGISKISDGGISPMRCLTHSTLASNICLLPQRLFLKAWHRNKAKPLSFSTSRDSWRTPAINSFHVMISSCCCISP